MRYTEIDVQEASNKKERMDEKMKKLLCMLLSVLLVLSLVACGGTEKVDQEPPVGGDDAAQTQSVDLKAAAEEAIAAISSDDVVLFPEENPEAIESVYTGLTAVETKQLVVYLPPVLGNACEIVMVETANAADAETVRGILQSRVDTAANDTAYPENAEGWKNNAVITVNGNYVVLAAMPDGIELPAALKAEF